MDPMLVRFGGGARDLEVRVIRVSGGEPWWSSISWSMPVTPGG